MLSVLSVLEACCLSGGGTEKREEANLPGGSGQPPDGRPATRTRSAPNFFPCGEPDNSGGCRAKGNLQSEAVFPTHSQGIRLSPRLIRQPAGLKTAWVLIGPVFGELEAEVPQCASEDDSPTFPEAPPSPERRAGRAGGPIQSQSRPTRCEPVPFLAGAKERDELESENAQIAFPAKRLIGWPTERRESVASFGGSACSHRNCLPAASSSRDTSRQLRGPRGMRGRHSPRRQPTSGGSQECSRTFLLRGQR